MAAKDENTKIVEAALKNILKNTDKSIIDFLKKKDLLEEFKKEYAESAKKKPFNMLTFDAKVMFDDADGTHEDGFDMSFEEFDYLAEWWRAYRKQYPGDEDNGIYRVGYEEAGEGAWSIEAVDEIFKSKKPRTFDFDNGWSEVKVTTSFEKDYKFENEYADNKTDPSDDEDFYPDGLEDLLLRYASYWYANGKDPECLVGLPEVW